MKKRLLAGALCGVATAIVQLQWRPAWRHRSAVTDVLLGSLPNFLAALGFALFFLAWHKPLPTVLAVLGGVLAHEVFTQSTPAHAFGGRFDWYDLGASVLGALAAYGLDAAWHAPRPPRQR